MFAMTPCCCSFYYCRCDVMPNWAILFDLSSISEVGNLTYLILPIFSRDGKLLAHSRGLLLSSATGVEVRGFDVMAAPRCAGSAMGLAVRLLAAMLLGAAPPRIAHGKMVHNIHAPVP